jgi:hypothetical protein
MHTREDAAACFDVPRAGRKVILSAAQGNEVHHGGTEYTERRAEHGWVVSHNLRPVA